MALVTTRSRYGLRFLIDLAERGASGPIDLASIAHRQEISEPYLQKLTIPLKAAGVIRAARGARGGFELARKPEAIDLLSIVELLDGRSSLRACAADAASCGRSGSCAALPVWKGLEGAVRSYLRGISLADLSASPEPDYSI